MIIRPGQDLAHLNRTYGVLGECAFFKIIPTEKGEKRRQLI